MDECSPEHLFELFKQGRHLARHNVPDDLKIKPEILMGDHIP